jgi:hypothetical protein
MQRRLKREASDVIPDPAPASSRQRTDNNNNNNNNNFNAIILERLNRLEAENGMLKKKVENLEKRSSNLEQCSSTKLVEFKFISMKTHLLDDNEWNGTLHVPLIQNPISGLYKIPNGTSTVHGKYTHKKKNNNDGSEVMITEDFFATIEKDLDGDVSFHLGISLMHRIDNAKNMYHILLNPSNNLKRERCAKVQEFFVESKNNGVVDEWALKGGGVLSFNAPVDVRGKQITFEIKLQIVLSAYEPHQTIIPEIKDNGVEIKWKRLEAVMQSRYPDRVYVDIQNAVKQYAYFLELKKDKNDYQCRFYSPSLPIKEVWFAHLSFLDRYQRDIQAFTGVKSKIFENIPITKDKSISRYNDTREAHVKRMADLSELVDTKYWSENGGRSSPSTSRATSANNDNHLTKGRWSIFPIEKKRWSNLWLYLDKTLGWSYLERRGVSTIWFRPGFSIKDRGKLGTDHFLNEDDVLAYCDENCIRPSPLTPPSPTEEEDEREAESPLSRDEEMENIGTEMDTEVDRYLTGTKIMKKFEDGDWYNGKIKSYNKKREYYIIEYEDGEIEEFDQDDVKQWLKYAVGTKIKKKVWDGNWYNGEIKSYNRKRGYYVIKYEDGESEEFDEDDVKQWLKEEEKEKEEDDDEKEMEDRYNFKILWSRLKGQGWEWQQPNNKFDDFWYVKPASTRPKSQWIKGLDYFCTQQEVVTFCKECDSASIGDINARNENDNDNAKLDDAPSKNMTKNTKNKSTLTTKKSGKKKKAPLSNKDDSDGKRSKQSNRPKRYKKKGRGDVDVDKENNDEPSNKNGKLSYLCNDENLKINNDGNDITPWKINAPLYEHKLCLAATGMSYLQYYYLPGENPKEFTRRFTSVEEVAQHFARTNDYTLSSSGSKVPTNDVERSFVRLIRYALVPGTLWMWKEIRKINRSETCYLLGTIGYRRTDSGGWKTPDALAEVLESHYESLDLLCEALSCLDYLHVPPSASRRCKQEINLSNIQNMALRLRIAEGFACVDYESEEGKKNWVKRTEDTIVVPSWIDVKPLLEKLGHFFYENYDEYGFYCCRPNGDPRNNKDAVEGEDYFTGINNYQSLQKYRGYLCAHGVDYVENLPIEEESEQIATWVRFYIFHSKTGERNPVPIRRIKFTAKNTKYKGIRILQQIGYKFVHKGLNMGYLLADDQEKKYLEEDELWEHLGKYGISAAFFDGFGSKDEQIATELLIIDEFHGTHGDKLFSYVMNMLAVD